MLGLPAKSSLCTKEIRNCVERACNWSSIDRILSLGFTHKRWIHISNLQLPYSVRAEPVEAILNLKNPSTGSGRTEKTIKHVILSEFQFVGKPQVLSR
jgi:hypothetical protein